MIASPGYAALPSAAKAEAIRDIIAKAEAIRDIIAKTREAATKAILVAYSGLVKGIARRRLEQVTAPR